MKAGANQTTGTGIQRGTGYEGKGHEREKVGVRVTFHLGISNKIYAASVK